jgi:hypothetical protein
LHTVEVCFAPAVCMQLILFGIKLADVRLANLLVTMPVIMREEPSGAKYGIS